jgi:hypothetical protein
MIALNQVVRTSYGTGPYRITHVSEPCTCAEYLRSINGDDSPSEPHHHITCTPIDGKGDCWLNGYRADGTSVWRDDRLVFDGVAQGFTGDLFG